MGDYSFEWRCHLCNARCLNDAARSNHMRNFWKRCDDPTRCDNILIARRRRAVPLITIPTVPLDVRVRMARRRPLTWATERLMRQRYAVVSRELDADAVGARDFTMIQDRWDAKLSELEHLNDKKFWTLFLAMYTLSGTAIDSALGVVKKLFKSEVDVKRFPISRRSLLTKMQTLVPFWPLVLHTVRIDLSRFKLPSGTKEIRFKFVDPVWGWLVAARRQDPLELHWRPIAQRRGHEVYGQGIHCGKLFKHACDSVPRGSYPMCVGLHWDGTAAHGLSSSPICVCVGNSNSCKSDTQFCIGYMPHVSDEKKPEWNKTETATTVKWYLRQQCATAILKVLEEAASRGIKCRLPNQHNDEVIRLLFPRLSSMNFDQPEAQCFFGMQNKQSCSKCRRRRGRSAFRKHRRHVPKDIEHLYNVANDEDSAARTLAREKLHRYGFNYTRKCCVLTICDALLVRVPGTDDVFPGIDYRDRMHGMFIFLHRILFQVFDDLIGTSSHRQILDQRLARVCARQFRREGKCVKAQKSIFTDVGMTAGDKADVIFFLSHVIGPGPDDIIGERVYMPLATAVAQAQLMLIATRGRRSYSKQELVEIFDKGFVLMFGALESVRQASYEHKVRKWGMSASAVNPPKRFKPTSR